MFLTPYFADFAVRFCNSPRGTLPFPDHFSTSVHGAVTANSQVYFSNSFDRYSLGHPLDLIEPQRVPVQYNASTVHVPLATVTKLLPASR